MKTRRKSNTSRKLGLKHGPEEREALQQGKRNQTNPAQNTINNQHSAETKEPQRREGLTIVTKELALPLCAKTSNGFVMDTALDTMLCRVRSPCPRCRMRKRNPALKQQQNGQQLSNKNNHVGEKFVERSNISIKDLSPWCILNHGTYWIMDCHS